MAINARFHRLSNVHRAVDEHIRAERRKARPDGWRLLRLAALRARVKARLTELLGGSSAPSTRHQAFG